MKHLFRLTCLLIFITAFSHAQEKYNSLLWEITGSGLSSPSYLFGTMHTSMEKYFNLSDSVFLALESTESFAGEINMDSIGNIFGKIMESSNKSGQDISKLLNKEELDLLNKKLKEILGIGLESLPVKSPVLISFLLEKDLYKGDMPFPLDEYLYMIAKNRNKFILGLESVDDQVNLLNKIPFEDIKETLLNSIYNKGEKESEALLNKILEAYAAEDLKKIGEIASSEIGEGSVLDTMFLVERNLNMAENIDKFVKEKTIFIAVGAAHLPGEKGLLNLLKKKGFIVRPVKPVRTGLANKYKNEITNPKK